MKRLVKKVGVLEREEAKLTVKSLLLPISMIVMFGLACWRASSSQLARWLNVSRLTTPKNLKRPELNNLQTKRPVCSDSGAVPSDVVHQESSSSPPVI